MRIRRFELRNLTAFLAELGIADVPKVSFSALESYQRHQYHHRKADGTPLSFRTQSHRLVAVKLLFSWLVRQGRLGFDPAAAIELPKVERHLPEATLSAEEAEAVLAGPASVGSSLSSPPRTPLVGTQLRGTGRGLGPALCRRSEAPPSQVPRCRRAVPLGQRGANVRRVADAHRTGLRESGCPGQER